MTFHADLWSGVAQRQLATLPAPVRDQVEACVQEICRDPSGAGEALLGERTRQLYGAQAGSVVIIYQIDELGEMVHILRVVNRG